LRSSSRPRGSFGFFDIVAIGRFVAFVGVAFDADAGNGVVGIDREGCAPLAWLSVQAGSAAAPSISPSSSATSSITKFTMTRMTMTMTMATACEADSGRRCDFVDEGASVLNWAESVDAFPPPMMAAAEQGDRERCCSPWQQSVWTGMNVAVYWVIAAAPADGCR
jgi:hypothetical protein